MNHEEAKKILRLRDNEKNTNKDLRDYKERVKFLKKWSTKYLEELLVIEKHYLETIELIKMFPSNKEVKEAQGVCYEMSKIDKELKRLNKRKVHVRRKR